MFFFRLADEDGETYQSCCLGCDGLLDFSKLHQEVCFFDFNRSSFEEIKVDEDSISVIVYFKPLACSRLSLFGYAFLSLRN